MNKWKCLFITPIFLNHWQRMDVRGWLQLTIDLLTGNVEVLRPRTSLNSVVRQKYFCPIVNQTQSL